VATGFWATAVSSTHVVIVTDDTIVRATVGVVAGIVGTFVVIVTRDRSVLASVFAAAGVGGTGVSIVAVYAGVYATSG
jgi:hypothetical protein